MSELSRLRGSEGYGACADEFRGGCGAFVGCIPVFPCRGYSGMAAGCSAALAAFCSKTEKTAARSKSSPSFRAVMGFVLSGVR